MVEVEGFNNSMTGSDSIITGWNRGESRVWARRGGGGVLYVNWHQTIRSLTYVQS